MGTDNLGLLNSDLYLGERHARVRGERYDEFIDSFVRTVTRLFPQAMLHWEDFGANTAHRILDRYRDEICTFNDDIQGTAAVALAAVLAGVNVTGMPLKDHRIVIYGGGTAGIGIADLIRDTLVRGGVSAEDAARQFYGLGSRGLFVDDQPTLRDFQRRTPGSRAEVDGWDITGDTARGIGLADVVRNVQPTILIGTSTVAGAFSEEIVTEMAPHVDRPIIMPLSNPTSRAEALPADLIAWTGGRALIATGSPFGPVDHDEVRHVIAQANNALIFPGLGLGVAASQASRITDGMIVAAAETLARQVNTYRPGASLLPGMERAAAGLGARRARRGPGRGRRGGGPPSADRPRSTTSTCGCGSRSTPRSRSSDAPSWRSVGRPGNAAAVRDPFRSPCAISGTLDRWTGSRHATRT